LPGAREKKNVLLSKLLWRQDPIWGGGKKRGRVTWDTDCLEDEDFSIANRAKGGGERRRLNPATTGPKRKLNLDPR